MVNSTTNLSLKGSVYPFIWVYSQTPNYVALGGSVYPHIGSTVRLRPQLAIVLWGSVYIPILGLQSDSNVPVNCLKGSVYPCIWSTVRPTYLSGDQYIPSFGSTVRHQITFLRPISISLYLVNSKTKLSLRGSVYPCIWSTVRPTYLPRDQYIPSFGSTARHQIMLPLILRVSAYILIVGIQVDQYYFMEVIYAHSGYTATNWVLPEGLLVTSVNSLLIPHATAWVIHLPSCFPVSRNQSL